MQSNHEQQPATELNREAPAFQTLTDSGLRDLKAYRGKWLALMYCPRGACAMRAECLDGLRLQARDIATLGGELLLLHPSLGLDDEALELILRHQHPKSLLVGSVTDPKFLSDYHLGAEDGAGHGVTGVFLIDPQGLLRAAARYTACAPVVAHEIASLMQLAIARFGQTGKECHAESAEAPAVQNPDYGCVEWFQYR
jgi:hypothetical protein